jgi:dihydrofolate reductase
MTLVTAQVSLSLDGFYAGPKHAETDGWMESPEAAAFFRITRWVVGAMAWRERQGFGGGERGTNSEILEEAFQSAGAYVMGRRMADGGEVPWGDEPPFHAPVFVVTHRARETLVRDGGTSFIKSPTAWRPPSTGRGWRRTGRTWRSPAAARCCAR